MLLTSQATRIVRKSVALQVFSHSKSFTPGPAGQPPDGAPAFRQSWCEERCFTQEEVTAFCKLTRDNNPIHLDPTKASASGFSHTIVPGILVASLFPAIIARAFPGAVYLSQSLTFRAPVQIPADIKATVTQIGLTRGFTEFKTVARHDSKVVVDGSALAKIPT